MSRIDGTYDVNLEFTYKVSFGLFGHGKGVKEAIADFRNSHQEMKEYYAESGEKLPACVDFVFENANKT